MYESERNVEKVKEWGDIVGEGKWGMAMRGDGTCLKAY